MSGRRSEAPRHGEELGDYRDGAEIPDLADLIWLFETEPEHCEDLYWPVGLHSFRLSRGATTVLFSIDPLPGSEACDRWGDYPWRNPGTTKDSNCGSEAGTRSQSRFKPSR